MVLSHQLEAGYGTRPRRLKAGLILHHIKKFKVIKNIIIVIIKGHSHRRACLQLVINISEI